MISGNEAAIASAQVEDETATLDPGTFTLPASDDWAVSTVSVAPNTTAILHDATNGRLQLPGDDVIITGAEQDITVGAGNISNVHVLKFRMAGYGTAKVGFRVGTASGGVESLAEVELGDWRALNRIYAGSHHFLYPVL